MSTSIQFSRANGEVTFIFDLSLSLKRQAFFGEFVPLFSPRPHLHKNRSFEYKTAALLLQLTFLRILERERERSGKTLPVMAKQSNPTLFLIRPFLPNNAMQV